MFKFSFAAVEPGRGDSMEEIREQLLVFRVHGLTSEEEDEALSRTEG